MTIIRDNNSYTLSPSELKSAAKEHELLDDVETIRTWGISFLSANKYKSLISDKESLLSLARKFRENINMGLAFRMALADTFKN